MAQEEKKTAAGGGRAVVIELIMFLTYSFFAVNWIAGSTLTSQIMSYFGLTTLASASLISNAITIAKIIGNFVAAGILTKLYPKKSIALGSLLIVVGSVIAILAPSYAVFVIGRFVMGFGGALYVVYFSPVVIYFFSPKARPTVNAFNSVAYNVGSILALIIVGPVIAWLSTWQYSMAFFAAISAILFVLWLIFGEDFDIGRKNASQTEQANAYTLKDALKDKFNWIFPFTYSGLLTLYIVLLALFPTSDHAAIAAKTLSTLIAVGGIVGTLIAIWLSKRYTKRLPVIRICGVLMTLAGLLMLVTSSGAVACVAAVAIGTFMFLPVTSLVLIPQELEGMTPARLTTIMGLFWAISYIIETIVYYLITVIIDAAGYTAGMYTALAFSLTFVIGGFLLPETGGKKA